MWPWESRKAGTSRKVFTLYIFPSEGAAEPGVPSSPLAHSAPSGRENFNASFSGIAVPGHIAVAPPGLVEQKNLCDIELVFTKANGKRKSPGTNAGAFI
ncbi:MAG: hypothetical protein AB7H80_08100 [Candidatus Kapaibacterium sp.]